MSDPATRRSSSPVASLSRPVTPPTSATIRVSPSEFTFQTSKTNSQVLVGRVSLRIVAADAPIGFKFKTNAPDRYSVRPVLGVLWPSGESVEIFARCEGTVQSDDRFMIESITLTEEEAQHLDSKKQWRGFDRRRIVENFIHCRMPLLHSNNSSSSSFHTVNLAPSTIVAATTTTANTSRSTSASPRMRSHLSHSRMPSLELPMSRRTNVAHSYTANTATTHGNTGNNNPHHQQQQHQQHQPYHQQQQQQYQQQHHGTISPNSSYTSSNNIGTHRSASPVHRPLVVGNRVSSCYGSDVEVGLDNEEKRDRMGQHYSMSNNNSNNSNSNNMATGGKRACRMTGSHPVDKGLVDLLPQILIFLLACVIVTFWMPISRWIGALLWPLFGDHVMSTTGGYQHLHDSVNSNPLHTETYNPNTGMPAAAVNGNPLVMAHA